MISVLCKIMDNKFVLLPKVIDHRSAPKAPITRICNRTSPVLMQNNKPTPFKKVFTRHEYPDKQENTF